MKMTNVDNFTPANLVRKVARFLSRYKIEHRNMFLINKAGGVPSRDKISYEF